MTSAWEGVDLAVVREAAADNSRQIQLQLGRNLFGGQHLIYVQTTDPFNPRRKPQPVLPGPLVAADRQTWADMLRILADVLDGTVASLVATDPRDDLTDPHQPERTTE